MTSKKETVFVGLSGGVDSSVAALRLKKTGYNVVGVFIKTWQPDFIVCNWENERLDAMRVAAHLDIPFLTCDATEEYKESVVDYLINEYKSGRTPNPDVMCNKYVKFDAFLKFAIKRGADKIATGHYAQVRETEGVFKLSRGTDSSKDQTYFLWTLTQKQLKHTLFPIGDTVKSKIRDEAEEAGLSTFSKQDSQGVCFLGEIDMAKFISHFVDTDKGNVLNVDGDIIGTHEGSILYTIGQRHGFKIENIKTSSKPLFVTEKDLERNTITVSETYPKINSPEIHLKNINLISKNLPDIFDAQFRYRQKSFKVRLKMIDSKSGMLTVLTENIDRPSVGQSCVFYDNDKCIGGGVIK